jgi:hypothetical protein
LALPIHCRAFPSSRRPCRRRRPSPWPCCLVGSPLRSIAQFVRSSPSPLCSSGRKCGGLRIGAVASAVSPQRRPVWRHGFRAGTTELGSIGKDWNHLIGPSETIRAKGWLWGMSRRGSLAGLSAVYRRKQRLVAASSGQPGSTLADLGRYGLSGTQYSWRTFDVAARGWKRLGSRHLQRHARPMTSAF